MKKLKKILSEVSIVLLSVALTWFLGNTVNVLDSSKITVENQEITSRTGFPLTYSYSYWKETPAGGYTHTEYKPTSLIVDLLLIYTTLRLSIWLLKDKLKLRP